MGRSNLPTPDEERNLTRLLPDWKTTLEYCSLAALEKNEAGSLAYDAHADEVIYHYRVLDIDRSILDLLHGTDEIWIITSANTES